MHLNRWTHSTHMTMAYLWSKLPCMTEAAAWKLVMYRQRNEIPATFAYWAAKLVPFWGAAVNCLSACLAWVNTIRLTCSSIATAQQAVCLPCFTSGAASRRWLGCFRYFTKTVCSQLGSRRERDCAHFKAFCTHHNDKQVKWIFTWCNKRMPPEQHLLATYTITIELLQTWSMPQVIKSTLASPLPHPSEKLKKIKKDLI